MMTHEQAVAVLQRIMDVGDSGWLRPVGALGWNVWWEEPGLLVQDADDLTRWLGLLGRAESGRLEVQHG